MIRRSQLRARVASAVTHLVECDDMTIVHQQLQPGACEAPHRHEFALEFVFVLNGALVVHADGARTTVQSNQGFAVLPRATHHLCNESHEVVDLLLVASPSTSGDHVAVFEPPGRDRPDDA